MDRKPSLMYGYLRQELVGDHIQEIEGAMREFAAREGFALAMVHREFGATTGALWMLLRDVSQASSRHIITPTPTHLQGGRNADRLTLLSQLQRVRQLRVWYLDPDDDAALVRTFRRNRDIPSPRASAPTPPRTPIGHFELRLTLATRGQAQLQIHELLTRAGLRYLSEPVEQIVLAVLAEAMAAAEPGIFARVAAGFPDLAPANQMTVWLLRRESTLEVQVHETASRADEPMSDPITACPAHGRVQPEAGGTLTWARIPLAVTPSVSHSSLRSAVS
ncbi:hypothetical protein [Nocardia farcinica]|uniref:hypothetical protein n=1 Tax=Nocardia farcinica TaxID=37329 RepID=UPI0024566F17|nr:hypothetical protein [Nocardia farcinica]